MRVGHGFDVHALTIGCRLILGGVQIHHEKGLQGHSDADVLIHAICDACLGALGLGDLGQHFPDTDAQYRDIDSRQLLHAIYRLIQEHDSRVINVDSTIVVQEPKIASYIPQMRSNISKDLIVAVSQVNIKATTTERLGYLGREEGIAAHAVVLLDDTN